MKKLYPIILIMALLPSLLINTSATIKFNKIKIIYTHTIKLKKEVQYEIQRNG